MKQLRSTARLFLALGAAALMAGCASANPEPAPAPETTPTVSPLFSAPTQPTYGPLFPAPTSAAGRSPTPPAAPAPMSVAEASGLQVVPVFDEQLRPGWEATGGSEGVRLDLQRRGFAYTGNTAIAVRPLGGEGRAQLSLGAGAKTGYPRAKVMAVSFWLSGGDKPLAPEDLAVAVIGSNRLRYWDPEDDSVQLEGRITDGEAPLFSETRLYYLEINQTIPANTWVEVVVWLDDLVFDPDYRYVTGFYVKNDELFQGTYYIDNINLLLL